MITHHERVHQEVVVLERIESGRSVNAVLVGLAELEGRYDSSDTPEHHVVEQLHVVGEEMQSLSELLPSDSPLSPQHSEICPRGASR